MGKRQKLERALVGDRPAASTLNCRTFLLFGQSRIERNHGDAAMSHPVVVECAFALQCGQEPPADLV